MLWALSPASAPAIVTIASLNWPNPPQSWPGRPRIARKLGSTTYNSDMIINEVTQLLQSKWHELVLRYLVHSFQQMYNKWMQYFVCESNHSPDGHPKL